MQIKTRVTPALKTVETTRKIMFELGLSLLVILALALFKAYHYSISQMLHLIYLTLASLITSYLCEIAYAYITKQDIKKFLRNSFPYITPLILVLIVPMNIGIYPIIIATIIGVIFGKLLFGGFGQNVFNPAAVARGVIFASFTSAVVPDLISSATPVATIKSVGFIMSQSELNLLISDFGGLSNLLLGFHNGAVGETFSLAIILVGIYLSIRKIIDWRIPVVYVGSIFVLTFIIGMIHGLDFSYALYHILTGGVLFAAVFMLTDPVTHPTTKGGKVLFALIAALITLLIRFLGNSPEGVLFSILLSNMLTPSIDRLFDGRQTLIKKKNYLYNGIVLVLSFVIMISVGFSLKAKNPYKSIHVPTFENGATIKIDDSELGIYRPKLVSKETNDGITTYVISAKGYGLLDPDNHGGDGYKENVFEIKIDDNSKTVKEVKFLEFGDTVNIGDKAVDEGFYYQFIDKSISDEIDVVSGATYSSKSLASAVRLALNGGESYKKGDSVKLDLNSLNQNHVNIKEVKKNSIIIEVKGFAAIEEGGKANVFEVSIKDNKISRIKLIELNDTPGIGDKIDNLDFLDSFKDKTLNDEVDLISGATYSSKSVVGAALKALEESK